MSSLFAFSGKRKTNEGFALVSTLLLIAILVVLVAALATSVTLSQRSVSAERDAKAARQSALVGMKTALGELQAAAGPDQRITATASLLDNSTNVYTGGIAPAAGQRAWTGVWKSGTVAPSGETPDYDPSKPDERKFVGWLVSGTDESGNFALPDDLDEVKTDVAATPPSDEGVDNHITLVSNSDGTPHLQVEKVYFDEVKRGKRYFAFSVEDESVKADLSWSEALASSVGEDRARQMRLSSVPGPDYSVLAGPKGNGPFVEGAHPVDYPISLEDGNEFLSDSIALMRDPADLETLMSDVESVPEWLEDMRGEITWGSRGVMADVKFGGLRRDLSLAFEMDGDADVTASEQPVKFNQQVGEFVGNGDRLSAPEIAKGMTVAERFLYRDYRESGTPFSDDIVARSQTAVDNSSVNGLSIVRGPNWWSLRDYANLYKRLRGISGNYTLDARSYYPNVSAANNAKYYLGNYHGANSRTNTWDHEHYLGWAFRIVGKEKEDHYIYKPARTNYAPVLLGYTALYSALTTNSDGTTADLALGIDPFFFLWNPYNRKLETEKYAVQLTTFPGHITFWVTDSGGQQTRHGPVTIKNYLHRHAVSEENQWQGGSLSYLVSDLSMEPGEVVVVSPRSNRSASANVFHDEAFPGTNTDNKSGAILTEIPVFQGYKRDGNGNITGENVSYQKVRVNLQTDKVSFLYAIQYSAKAEAEGDRFTAGNQGMAEHFWINSSLPPPGTNANQLPSRTGEHVQQIGNNAQGDISVPEYFDPPRRGANQLLQGPTGTESAAALLDTKRFFGAGCYLAKPAAHEGDWGEEVPLPIEVFTQFNPFPVGGYGDMWRPCLLNQVFSAIADPGDVDTLLQRSGINFPAALLENGYFGESYAGGSTSVPMSNIPSSPIMSLAALSHANFAVGAAHPFHAIGNSWANVHVSPVSPYGKITGMSWVNSTASDRSWLLNDSLFDRYYLSGIAPSYSIDSNGYSADGTLSDRLDQFFGSNFRDARANPVMRPYLPPGVTADDAVAALAADDGYKKMGAYSLIQGQFNVNSTSVAAWESLLRANRDLAVQDAQGGSDSGTGAPFPGSDSPAGAIDGSQDFWTGFSRLDDDQLKALAESIVDQVELRGPFMSLSDFVNHRVGTPKNDATHYMGALQAAIEASGINSPVQASAGGISPVYDGAISKYFPDPLPSGNRKTTTGIAGDINQANLLLPLAPRLSARSDTFRIRAYGEVRSSDESRITSKAACEAVVQRVPEYMDPDTDPGNNEPWDEVIDPITPGSPLLNEVNQRFGRRFKIVQFRWLAPDEL